MAAEAVPLLITGATGRVGRALRPNWPMVMRAGLRPIWQSRKDRPGFQTWDILHSPCPDIMASGVVLALAGVTQGPAADLALNRDLALAACEAAAAQGARHVFLASSAAVYGGADLALNEDSPPNPASDYGLAKLAMEQAALGWQAKAGPNAPGLTLLRIGNIAGLDALLGAAQPGVAVQLDPVAGAEGGPVRSYIGPVTLGAVLARLVTMAAQRNPLSLLLNIAAPQPLRMADLLQAADQDWRFGPPNPQAIARVVLDTTRLQGLVRLPPLAGRAAVMVAEWRGLAHANL